jgi:Fic-DOC domain mobile mystery protein B
MGLDLHYIEGQTPIDDDEKSELLIKTISTRADLDEFEQLNIEKAVEWTLKTKFEWHQILTEKFIKAVHEKMFGDVWIWAGQFRRSNKNMGVDKHRIPLEIKKILDDCAYWIEHKVFLEDEIAVRFSHRIVSIHPFPNGNGRHARLIADILVSHGLKRPHFSWGRTSLASGGISRSRYLEALKEADENHYDALIKFARE